MKKDTSEYLGQVSVFRVPFKEQKMNGKVMLLTIRKCGVSKVPAAGGAAAASDGGAQHSRRSRDVR
eukprot:6066122-Amphidinium_carterae.1